MLLYEIRAVLQKKEATSILFQGNTKMLFLVLILSLAQKGTSLDQCNQPGVQPIRSRHAGSKEVQEEVIIPFF